MKRFIVRTGLGIVMGGLLWGGLAANQASAAEIQYFFTGSVDHVQNLLNPPFHVDGGTDGYVWLHDSQQA